MRIRDCSIVAVTIALLVAVVVVPGAHARCLSGTITADFQTSGSYIGYYKYTLTITWDTPWGLSNVTLDCGFGDCPEQGCLHSFLFDWPSGYGTGVGGCDVFYVGEFNCNGNPSIGLTNPVIKWDAVGDCEPDKVGTATLCFYSMLGPDPECSTPVVLIKDGRDVCQGTIEGDCPTAPCVLETEEASWGAVKAKYH